MLASAITSPSTQRTTGATTARSANRTSTSGGYPAPAPPSESFQAGESKPEFMELGRKQWTLISTNAAPTTKVQKALGDAKMKAGLAKFSPQLQQQVGGLSDAQLKVLKGGMTGSTEVGPITIDNRKAFIKGSVALKSIWGNVHQSITDARSKYGMINATEEKGLHKLIDSVSPLKPEQRKQLADLMDSVR